MTLGNRAFASRIRRGFTLIELLIVILIIAILASLTTAAIMRAFARAQEVRARAEISQLSQAVSAFKSHFGRYPPTRVWTGSLTGGDEASRQFVLSCWPRINPRAGLRGPGWVRGPAVLTFFLGGQRTTNPGGGFDTHGFSADPEDPMKPFNVNDTRIRPFYEFRADRLRMISENWPVYVDIFDTKDMGVPGNEKPYLYFGCGARGNDYDTNIANAYNVRVYRDSNQHFWKPDSFQIVCAGADGVFGTASNGLWTAPQAHAIYPPPSGTQVGSGHDDLTNFYEVRMGYSPR